MQTTASDLDASGFRKAGVRGTTFLMVSAWLIPLGVHLIPWQGSTPLGAHLLPMFWATFVAVYLYGSTVALTAGLLAPAINLALTGLPAWRFLAVLSFELVIFALVTVWLTRRTPGIWLWAPLGYVVAKLASTGLQASTHVFGEIGTPGTFLLSSLTNAWAGLGLLTLINLGLTRIKPPAQDWDEQ